MVILLLVVNLKMARMVGVIPSPFSPTKCQSMHSPMGTFKSIPMKERCGRFTETETSQQQRRILRKRVVGQKSPTGQILQKSLASGLLRFYPALDVAGHLRFKHLGSSQDFGRFGHLHTREATFPQSICIIFHIEYPLTEWQAMRAWMFPLIAGTLTQLLSQSGSQKWLRMQTYWELLGLQKVWCDQNRNRSPS